ncbi:hypothetical protein [Actinophytocola oryzae]|uniref:Uncharacterized protein n=1 Tax=Actinophytocola oryzae TaxID=502181 RepID=A0A4R7UW27_9PSEU|nr:hypothetical protein [Actinophytocola oryzae]TDV40978.1 hypothetical protein CLV71_12144 [Actinophytocola oryzae]
MLQDRLARLAGESGATVALEAVETAANWAAAELAVVPGGPRPVAIGAVSALDRALRAVAGLRDRVGPLVTAAGLRDELRGELEAAVLEGDALGAEVSRLATEQRQLQGARQANERRRAEAVELAEAVAELRRVRRAAEGLPELRRLRDELAVLTRPVAGDVSQVEEGIAMRAAAVVETAGEVLASLPVPLAAAVEDVRVRTKQVDEARARLAEQRAKAARLGEEVAAVQREIAVEDDRILAQARRLEELRTGLSRKARRAGEVAGAHEPELAERANRLEVELGELAAHLTKLETEAGTLRDAAQRRSDGLTPIRLGDALRPNPPAGGAP